MKNHKGSIIDLQLQKTQNTKTIAKINIQIKAKDFSYDTEQDLESKRADLVAQNSVIDIKLKAIKAEKIDEYKYQNEVRQILCSLLNAGTHKDADFSETLEDAQTINDHILQITAPNF